MFRVLWSQRQSKILFMSPVICLTYLKINLALNGGHIPQMPKGTWRIFKAAISRHFSSRPAREASIQKSHMWQYSVTHLCRWFYQDVLYTLSAKYNHPWAREKESCALQNYWKSSNSTSKDAHCLQRKKENARKRKKGQETMYTYTPDDFCHGSIKVGLI